MSRDNVTPFRRPPRRPAPKPSPNFGLTTHRGKAVFVHVLTLAAFAAPFLIGGSIGSIAGLALAVAAGLIAVTSRYDSMPWAATHHEHGLRTLIIAMVINTLTGLPSLMLPTDTLRAILGTYTMVVIIISMAVLIWVLIRSGVGLVLAIMRKPIVHPRGWLL